MKFIEFRISLKCVSKVRINNIPALIQTMAWHRPGDKPLSEPMITSMRSTQMFCNCFDYFSLWIRQRVYCCMGYFVYVSYTVYPKKYAHGFVVLCFVVVMQSFIMNSHEVFIHIHQGCFAGTGAIVRLPQCQWSKPVGYGEINQCITTTKHSKAKTVCIFLGIYCIPSMRLIQIFCN